MNESNEKNNKILSALKFPLNFWITILLVCSLFLVVGFLPFNSSTATVEAETDAETEAETTIVENPVLGVINVKGGDMLERDIIPQISKVFSLSQEDVKKTLAAANSNTLINPAIKDFRRMEGMIPPGEYEITQDITLEKEMSTWVEESEKRYNKILSSNTSSNNLTPQKQLSLAAMVEAECLSGTHQNEVATVFLNRLASNTKLQSCVTAEYALGYQRPFLTTEDTKKVSDYNTYNVAGLPVGPICTISDASLQAAMIKKMDSKISFFYYDYILNDMFFFDDYKKFQKDGAAAQKNFEQKSKIDKHAQINKQTTYKK
ncbi:endolytic transglycosylase MltG [Clostridium sp. SHJSY1]|uniref:endolytic transglycosylase MltG n=1 Tax=Clostridium sp. SHJSY1 TaxID=2942483 RepID=UPI00287630FB|nr:endolytic transglycosylase MltG [Clostridium sp. SHJSY1]MDS0525637.1 endolytic transglycosylase MltG [Clostridium sp. SHJSY1]